MLSFISPNNYDVNLPSQDLDGVWDNGDGLLEFGLLKITSSLKVTTLIAFYLHFVHE